MALNNLQSFTSEITRQVYNLFQRRVFILCYKTCVPQVKIAFLIPRGKRQEKGEKAQMVEWVQVNFFLQAVLCLNPGYKATLNVQLVISQVKILNKKPCVLLFQRNLVRLRTNLSELSVNTTVESHY